MAKIPAVYIVRHGSTALNGDDSTDRIRGWSNIPLNYKGEEDARKAAITISKIKTPLSEIVSSGFDRTNDTAKAIAQLTGLKIKIDERLRPWNVGEFTGKPTKDVKGKMQEYAKPENENKKIPGGESFREFLDRYLGALKEYMNYKVPPVLVAHLRNVKAAEGWLEEGMPDDLSVDTNRMKPNGDFPGMVVVINKDGTMKKLNDGDEEGISRYAKGGIVRLANGGNTQQSNIPITPDSSPQQSNLPVTPDSSPQQTTVSPGNDDANYLNPDGDLVSLPSNMHDEAINAGYKLAGDQDTNNYFQQQQFGTPIEQAKTVAEGALRSTIGPFAGAVETAAGVNPKNILARQQANPGSNMLGETAGLIGGALTGTGEAAGLKAIGEVGAEAVGLGAPTTVLSKIGSAAVKGAIENAAFSTGSELDKMVLGDPNTTIEAAIPNIGLSAIIGGGLGGAIGTVSPLWKATAGPKVNEFLQAFKNRVDGTPLNLPSEVDNAIQVSGVNPTPEVRAAMTGVYPKAAQDFNILREAKSSNILAGIDDLNQQTSQAAMDALGKTPEDVSGYSEAAQGRRGMEGFKQEYKAKYQPIADEYESLSGPFEAAELKPLEATSVQTPETLNNPYLQPQFSTVTIPGDVDILQEKIADLARNQGYDKSGLPQNDLIQQVQKSLPEMKTVQDLSNLASNIGKQGMMNPALAQPAREIKGLILDSQGDALERSLGEKSPELLERFKTVKGQYRDLASITSEMSRNLGLGKFQGPKTFLNALEEKRSPEEFLRKLSPDGNAEIIPFLQKNFPETLERVRENELYQLAEPAVRNAKEDLPINVKTLTNRIDKMTPEMRDFVFGGVKSGKSEGVIKESITETSKSIEAVKKQMQEAINANDRQKFEQLGGNLTTLESSLSNDVAALQNPIKGLTQEGALTKIQAAHTLQNSLPAYKSSGTAGWIDQLMSKVPGSATATAAMLTGHNPMVGFLIGQAGKLLARDAPDAVRLAMLKFMGSTAPIEAGGMKAGVEMAYNAAKGLKLANNAVKNVFVAGKEVLPNNMYANDKDREMINKKIVQFNNQPEKLMNAQNDLQHYFPDHAAAASQISSRVISYLGSIKPLEQTPNALPFDPPRQPSLVEKMSYDNALDIAQQPLSILNKIKEGTISSKDVTHLTNMYPSLQKGLAQKLTEQLVDIKTDEEKLPYKTRIGLSLFLGQPLDRSLTPQSIIAAQPTPQMSQPQTPSQPASKPKRSTTALNKVPAAYQTPLQASEQRRSTNA